MKLAAKNGIRTIALPAISTGIYGYPLDQAAPIAIATVPEELVAAPDITLARFVLFDDTALAVFGAALLRLRAAPAS
jgi:O-acetyl-ADP-ribose deacetylase (regulator of RNase III)